MTDLIIVRKSYSHYIANGLDASRDRWGEWHCECEGEEGREVDAEGRCLHVLAVMADVTRLQLEAFEAAKQVPVNPPGYIRSRKNLRPRLGYRY